MSESDAETPTTGIGDDRLPPDLVPGDDNPLAEPLEDGESVGDLLEEGKTAQESSDDSAESTDPADPTDSTGSADAADSTDPDVSPDH